MRMPLHFCFGRVVLLGLISLTFVLCGCPASYCPWREGEENWGQEDLDNDGKTDYLVVKPYKDDADNKIEIWATANCFRMRYWPSVQVESYRSPSPHPVWIGACKYRRGRNTTFAKGKDGNGNNVVDDFEKVEYANTNLETGVTDAYYFNAMTMHLRIVRYESHEKYQQGEDGEELYSGVAPTDLKELEEVDPPDEPEPPDHRSPGNRSAWYPPVHLFNVSDGPVWSYWIYIYRRLPQQFKAGDIISMGGAEIVSACVSGRAKKEAFGAWRVKNVSSDHVEFEATCDATVSSTFGCLSVVAPRAGAGKVRWLWMGQARGGWGDEVTGPVGAE